VFRGKIEGKSTFTRGLLIALNDVSSQARHAITQGKAPSFFVMNGHDLLMILRRAVGLPEFLRKRVRLLAEELKACLESAFRKHREVPETQSVTLASGGESEAQFEAA